MKFDVVVSIMGRSLGEMVTKAGMVAGDVMLEFRLDSLSEEHWSEAEAMRLPEELSKRSILTYRSPSQGGLSQAYSVDRLVELIGLLSPRPPAFMDIESSSINDGRVAASIEHYGGRLIISNHLPYGGTSVDELLVHWQRSKVAGHYIKIINMPTTLHEALLSLELYGQVDPFRLISFSAGNRWSFTRFTSVLLGSPLLYSCLPGEALAEGQPTVEEAIKFRRAIDDGA